jgi:hypothetical protein
MTNLPVPGTGVKSIDIQPFAGLKQIKKIEISSF